MSITTYCYCWLIVRADGARFAFTDHDKTLSFDGDDYLPVDGVLTTQIKTSLGLEIDELEVEGALSDDLMTENDLVAGLFDEASVTILMADWRDVIDRKILISGNLGSVVLTDIGFVTEFNSLANKLSKTQSSVYQRTCDADLGDSRCGIDLSNPLYRTTATILTASELLVEVDDLSAFSNGWFVLGEIVTPSGAKYGIRGQTGTTLELWEVPFPALSVSDVLTITAGCKKDRVDACKGKFDNVINFQGHGVFMPGQDALTDYPVRGEKDYDGGSLFK